jgi:hypothetical protein
MAEYVARLFMILPDSFILGSLSSHLVEFNYGKFTSKRSGFVTNRSCLGEAALQALMENELLNCSLGSGRRSNVTAVAKEARCRYFHEVTH